MSDAEQQKPEEKAPVSVSVSAEDAASAKKLVANVGALATAKVEEETGAAAAAAAASAKTVVANVGAAATAKVEEESGAVVKLHWPGLYCKIWQHLCILFYGTIR